MYILLIQIHMYILAGQTPALADGTPTLVGFIPCFLCIPHLGYAY